MSTLKEMKLKGIRNRLKYLHGVDWYSSRKVMQGTEIPTDVVTKAQQARDEISLIESATEYSEVEHLNATFE